MTVLQFIGVVAGAVCLLIGTVLTQTLLHRRWTREQEAKRDSAMENLLAGVAEQSSVVVQSALRVAEAHQEDAEKARLLAVETATNHAECRAEVAHLAGKFEEMRARQVENERIMGAQNRLSEADRGIKHDALTALTISEGTVDLVKKLVPKCTCNAFDPIDHLVSSFHPRAPALVRANSQIRFTPGLTEIVDGIGRMEAASAQVAADLAVAQEAVEGVASDLAASHDRANDAEDDQPGAAADAASRTPDTSSEET